jgi:acetyl esterase/lipase
MNAAENKIQNVLKKIMIFTAVVACTFFNAVHAADGTIRYRDKIFSSVSIQKDIVFREYPGSEGKKAALSMDFYNAENDAEVSRAAVILIHGGGFRPGNDKRQSYIGFLARDFAKRGFAVFSIDYRVRVNPAEDMYGTVYDAVYDASSALQWIFSHAKEYRVDERKIFIAGGSAGGIIAVNLCYGSFAHDLFRDKSAIKAVVNLWGSPEASDITSYGLRKDNPPMLIIHGTNDKQIPFRNSEHLLKILNDNEIKAELYPIKDGEHPPMPQMQEVADRAALFMCGFSK